MSVHHVHTNSELDTLIASTGLVIVDFSATWCGPCKRIAPHFEKLAKENPTVVFVHVDIDELSSHPLVGKVSGVPHFQVYKNKALVTEFSGANENKLNQVVADNK
eukprot:TRINITY_DN9626_c0_g1_i1.p2 TRINITY_DN9626_c0_g1~~TRINITY_DN9626_c0_g1_i1.p2  ORF type:complete len:105 (-),score=26.76 TRINITY_DN9626_c0_g1_i1:66-380(-)